MGDTSVVVVNWNSGPYLARCLSSLRGQQGLSEIIVVDNASTDDSLWLARSLKDVRFIEMGSNAGYASAVNVGLSASRGPYIVLSNPDVTFCEGSILAMAQVMDRLPLVGMVGPMLVSPDGSYQPSVRRFPHPILWAFDGTVLADLWPNNPWRRWFLGYDRRQDQGGPVDWLSGAVLAVRRRAVEDAGGMDERYFMYSEELDWCVRLHRRGWLVWYEPTAKVVHWGQISSSQVPVETHLRYQASRLRYLATYHGKGCAQLFSFLLYVDYSVRLALEATKWALGHRRDLRRYKMLLYWQVLVSALLRGWHPSIERPSKSAQGSQA